MSIEQKVAAVEALFQKLDAEIALFQEQTKLGCIAGCGKCCAHPEIDASPLEFLPWAFYLFVNGQAEKVLDDLATSTYNTCFIYNPKSLLQLEKGTCSAYKYRGLICRLFGYGANKNKYGNLRLATCTIIKEGQKETYDASTTMINNGLYVPVLTDYYMNLNQIDFHLGNIVIPINEALKRAIEEVLQYYAYRPMPDGHIDCA
jgi:hypothetical protein